MSSRALSITVIALVAAGVGLTATVGRESTRRMLPAAAATPAAATAITARGIGAHLDALQRIADHHRGTRAAGTPGDTATVNYVVARLRAAGWAVRTPVVRVPLFVERSTEIFAPGVAEGDYRVLTYSGSGDARARVRAVRDLGCDRADYAGVQAGEIALVRRGTCLLADKARFAEAAGAGAVLIVNTGDAPFDGTLGRPGVGVPVVALARQAADGLAGQTAQVTVDAISKVARLRNVIADSPAAPVADRGVVMAGAHLDSVAAGPGINDDGSGVAALLEAADVLRDYPVRLGFWNAEELGLYGSRAYVRSLSSAQRKRILAYVNLDMIGTPGGTPRVYGSDEVADAFGDGFRRTSIGAASDHAPFERAGIPVGGLYTGTHRCYHRACDTAARVDRPLATRMARTAVRAIEALA